MSIPHLAAPSATATPLAAATATIGGTGVVIDLIRDHLAALGVSVSPHATPATNGQAATAQIRLTDGRTRELVVTWAGRVHEPAITDEATTQAVCGVMHVHGRRNGEPSGLGIDYCGVAAGVLAMNGLLASVLDTGKPDERIETSVAEAALLAVSQYLAAAGADDQEAVDLAPGGPPFTSADGIRFELEALQPDVWAAFWSELDVPGRIVGRGWRPFQFRYATATAPLPHELHAATAQRSFADITERAARAGISVCRLVDTDAHAAEQREWQRRGWSPGWRITEGDRKASPTTKATELPLGGISVLEAGRRVQAPLAAHLLSLLGADVVRIEPPGGDPLRGMPPTSGDISARWLALNRLKRAVEIDIKNAADRARLYDLAANADVFLHNWAAGKAEELGLGAADLPGHLVYAYTSGWGGHPVPDAPMATDFMVQARTGLADLMRPSDQLAAPSLMTVLDVLGGLLGAESVLIGLLTRNVGLHGVDVESSLLGAATELRRAATGRRAPGFRIPTESCCGWSTAGVRVTTDLAALLIDERFGDVIGRDEHGAPALATPWRFA